MAVRVAFQGEHGAYSEFATQNLFSSELGGKSPKELRTIPKSQFEEVFQAVKSGEVSRGVIPIENSLAGSIHENFDLLQKYHLHIVAETQLRVEHVLMCHPDTNSRKLRHVISHPQALSQCSKYLNQRQVLTSKAFYDTAGAAKYIAENPSVDTGAIASIHAAKLYNLTPIKRNLENNHKNFTRFLAIAKTPLPKSQLSRYANHTIKTSISFAPKKNEQGVLFKMLSIFAEQNINFLRIESRPIPDRTFEYMFYLDFEGSPRNVNIQEALQQLEDASTLFQNYGSYPIGSQTYIP